MSEPTATKEHDNSADFREEAARIWKALPDKELFGVLLVAWLAMFHFLGNSTFGYVDSPSIFRWMYEIYSLPEGDDGHGLLIPGIVLGVLWWRRDVLLALPRSNWPPALLLLAGATLLHVFGFAAQQPKVSIVALFLGLYALVGITWGASWMKATLMPFSIFAFCVPISSHLTDLTMPLRLLATKISVCIAHDFLGFVVSRNGTQILDVFGTPRYDVAAACSGIRSLVSLFVLMTVFGMITYRSPWRRLALMLLSIPVALFCNVLRLLSVITAGEVFGHEAGNIAHEYSGFFTYAIAIGCMVALSRWWNEDTPTNP